MFRNYFKTGFRNLLKYKLFSFINIIGLATGMAVTLVIGLWVWDELSYDKYHKNYEQIGQAWQFVQFGPEKSSYNSMPIPLAEELRTNYPAIKDAVVTTYNRTTVLAHGDDSYSKEGLFAEPGFLEMMTPKLLAGAANGLKDMHSIMLSASLAKTMFGNDDPLNQVIRLNNKTEVKVTGVYDDFPANSTFHEVLFLAPWQLFTSIDGYAKSAMNEWDENSFPLYVQLKEGAGFSKVSAAIKDIRMKRDDPPKYKPEFFIHPMSKWHLEGDFKDGVNTGGLIKLVKLFGIAGIFVLLLACINFMNLSTARSEKRAKEVGIRKTIGSARSQLIYQFFSESLLVSFIALILCLLIAQVSLPFFNEVANKKMVIPWANPVFWFISIGFCLLTGIIAGSYPALYLSSFRPIKVLKGTFKAGRLASLPRKALVIFQFSVSVTLIIGTIIVFRQINHAKDRPIGYSYNGLIEIFMSTPDMKGHYDALRADLLATGVVKNVSQSAGSLTDDYGGTTNISWKGKDGDARPLFISNFITHDYGNTIGWQIREGRDFSRQYSTDSTAIILNKSAVQLMELKTPLQEQVRLSGKNYQVIAVVEDMIKDDPFKPVKPSVFTLNYNAANVVNVKLARAANTQTALAKIEKVFKKYNPAAPFEYKFVDEKYADKFATEVRIGKLAGFFASLAVVISCLGLFGLASFVAAQRTREIGIRKVLGASILTIWQLLSKDFLLLVVLSLLIASPLAYYFMHSWLQNYEYRTTIAWWIFAAAGLGAIILTIVTISFQAIRAALINPVAALRSE